MPWVGAGAGAQIGVIADGRIRREGRRCRYCVRDCGKGWGTVLSKLGKGTLDLVGVQVSKKHGWLGTPEMRAGVGQCWRGCGTPGERSTELEQGRLGAAWGR